MIRLSVGVNRRPGGKVPIPRPNPPKKLSSAENIIFGSIAVFTGAVIFLISKFKALKNAIAELEPATGSEALLNVQEKRLELAKLVAEMEEKSGGHALRTAKARVKTATITAAGLLTIDAINKMSPAERKKRLAEEDTLLL